MYIYNYCIRLQINKHVCLSVCLVFQLLPCPPPTQNGNLVPRVLSCRERTLGTRLPTWPPIKVREKWRHKLDLNHIPPHHAVNAASNRPQRARTANRCPTVRATFGRCARACRRCPTARACQSASRKNLLNPEHLHLTSTFINRQRFRIKSI